MARCVCCKKAGEVDPGTMTCVHCLPTAMDLTETRMELQRVMAVLGEWSKARIKASTAYHVLNLSLDGGFLKWELAEEQVRLLEDELHELVIKHAD